MLRLMTLTATFIYFIILKPLKSCSTIISSGSLWEEAGCFLVPVPVGPGHGVAGHYVVFPTPETDFLLSLSTYNCYLFQQLHTDRHYFLIGCQH